MSTLNNLYVWSDLDLGTQANRVVKILDRSPFNPFKLTETGEGNIFDRCHDDHDGEFIGRLRLTFTRNENGMCCKMHSDLLDEGKVQVFGMRFRGVSGGSSSPNTYMALRIVCFVLDLQEKYEIYPKPKTIWTQRVFSFMKKVNRLRSGNSFKKQRVILKKIIGYTCFPYWFKVLGSEERGGEYTMGENKNACLFFGPDSDLYVKFKAPVFVNSKDNPMLFNALVILAFAFCMDEKRYPTSWRQAHKWVHQDSEEVEPFELY